MTATTFRARFLRWLSFTLLACLLAVALLLAVVRLRYGGAPTGFPDRSGPPLLPGSVLETVAELPTPPGNIAVSAAGRVFISLHPEARPADKVVELVEGRAVPWPSAALQQDAGDGGPFFDTVLSVRIDRQGRLWTLDNAEHGLRQPRLLAFDVDSGRLVHRWDVPRDIAPLGSHLNDFQVAPDGGTVYIAEASLFGLTPALVVYDVASGRGRRVLEKHPSVVAERFVPVVQGRPMVVFGVFDVRPGVDSIALDEAGEWLYFAPVTSRGLYRARAADLRDPSLSPAALGGRVERFADKTMSDGITIDAEGGLYLSDLEHDAIVRLGPDRTLRTLVRDARLRWPDGLGFGPEGWLYVTCSALHEVIGRPPGQVRAAAPFHVYRFRPGSAGVPGH